MKNKITKMLTAMLSAFAILTSSFSPIYANAETEVDENGESSVTLTMEIEDADITWFKLRLPTEIALDSGGNYGEDGIFRDGTAEISAKGVLPQGKALMLSVPQGFTLTGTTDPSILNGNTALMVFDESSSGKVLNPNFEAGHDFLDGYSKWAVCYYAADQDSSALLSDIAAIELDPYDYYNDCTIRAMVNMGCDVVAQEYVGTLTFTISMQDI